MPRRSFAAGAVGIALLTAVAAAVAAVGKADATALSPIRPPGGWRLTFVAAVTIAFALYLVALLLLRRQTTWLPVVLGVATALQLVPLAAPLLLSTDAYSYWDYGRVAVVHDANPYADLPSHWPDDPAYRRMGADWRARKTVYGPAFTLTSEGVARVAASSPRTATLLFRFLAVAGMLGLVAATAVATRGQAFAVAFVGWNPLLALHFAGGGHNDVLMMALAIAALALRRLGHFRLEGAVWTGALAVKLIPAVFLPLRGLEAWRRRQLRAAGTGFAAAAAVTAVVASWLYGTSWLAVLSPLGNQLRQTSSLGLSYWLGRAGVSERIARDGLVLLFALLYVWLLREAWRGRARLALCAVGLLVATSWLHPWYAVWAVPFAAVEDDRSAQLGALALSAYFLQDALPL